VFNDPQVALANLRPGNYDLMIIDIGMPKVSGFDLYRELKKRAGSIKVCSMTAFEIYYEEFRKMQIHSALLGILRALWHPFP